MSRGKRWLVVLAVLLAGAAAIPVLMNWPAPKPAEARAPVLSKPENPGVGCMGRIEAGDGLIRVAAPYYEGRPSVVRELRVREGDAVRSGDLIATLDGRRELEAALAQAEARVKVARQRLEQILAGPKAADVEAHKAEIGRREAVLENARAMLKRFETLLANDDVTAADFDSKRTAVVTAERALAEARQRLASLMDIRPADVALAEAEVESALADVGRSRTNLDSTLVHSPVTGSVVRVIAHAGEAGDNGIVEIAETARMYAVAEVYEDDIRRVKVGQRAIITGDVLPVRVEGVVERVGMEIAKNQALTSDPVAYTDARIVPVRIRLSNPRAVASFIHARISVRIEP